MRTTAVIPIKRFGEAKQRLAAGLDDRRREAIVEAMLTDVLEAVSESRSITRTVVVSDEPRAVAAAESFGAVAIADPGTGGHSDAAVAGSAWAVEDGAECVVLLPGDCPLLDPRQLDRLLTGVPAEYVAVIADRHGTGTNGLLLRPPLAITPSFGEGSCSRHVELAREAGIPYAVEHIHSLGLDLDTPADLVAITRELESGSDRARRTAKALGI